MYTFKLNNTNYSNFDSESLAELVKAGKITQAEADVIIAEHEAKAQEKLEKTTGLEYASTGVIVPFTSDDAIGLLQVKAAFELGLANTVIKFSNGQSLDMVAADFPAFATWFVTERNKFFA